MPNSCNACGTTNDVRHPPLAGSLPICSACYMIWYDSGITDPEALGREHARRETAGEFPFKESTDDE